MRFTPIIAAISVLAATGCDNRAREPYNDYSIKVIDTDEARVFIPDQLHVKLTGRMGKEVYETPDGVGMGLKSNNDAKDRRRPHAVARLTSPPLGVEEDCSRDIQFNIRANTGTLREGDILHSCRPDLSESKYTAWPGGRCHHTKVLTGNVLVEVLYAVRSCATSDHTKIHSIIDQLKVTRNGQSK